MLFAYYAFWFQPLNKAWPATNWMGIYDAQDFKSLRSVFSFVFSLKVPIPPNLALLENLVLLYTGSYNLLSYWLYLISFFAAYVIAIFLCRTSHLTTLLTTILAVFFWHMTFVIHPGNPQLYDATLPAFLLGYILFYYLVLIDLEGRRAAAYCFLAGFCLTQAELTRPFIIYLFPVLLAIAFFTLRHRQKLLIYLILPIVLITIPWHTHQLINHKQFIASNHVGFNLARAWRMVSLPELTPEIHDQPLAPERWPNINTSEHTENSNRLKQAVFNYWIKNPLEFSMRTLKAIWYLWSGPSDIYAHKVTSRWLGVYTFTIRILAIFVVVVFLLEFVAACTRAGLSTAQSQINLLLCFMILMISLIYAVGEHDEEARFLISLLPLFTCQLHVILSILRKRNINIV